MGQDEDRANRHQSRIRSASEKVGFVTVCGAMHTELRSRLADVSCRGFCGFASWEGDPQGHHVDRRVRLAHDVSGHVDNVPSRLRQGSGHSVDDARTVRSVHSNRPGFSRFYARLGLTARAGGLRPICLLGAHRCVAQGPNSERQVEGISDRGEGALERLSVHLRGRRHHQEYGEVTPQDRHGGVLQVAAEVDERPTYSCDNAGPVGAEGAQ
jgi:hypothetical protein